MKTKLTAIAALGMAAMMATSCGTTKKAMTDNSNTAANKTTNVAESTTTNSTPEREIDYNTMQTMVDNNNDFALKLFGEVSGLSSRVVSPLSVSYLMGMLANGADGQTRQEILNALGCGNRSVNDLNAFYSKMIAPTDNSNDNTTVNIANYIAVNKLYNLKNDFQKTMQTYYKAGIETLDFANPEAVKTINSWCDKQTDGMIPNIIDRTEPDALSYILNAIYFNGTWTDKFDKADTKDEQFFGYTRDINMLPMMHREGKYKYTSNDAYAAVRMPYGNGKYTMTVMLPNNGKGVAEMMSNMNVDALAKMQNNMETCIVDLKLPRFTTEMKLDLNEIISALGAPTMFQPTADFSRFADGHLFVSKMLQKAKIEVSEEGTKAAAVTAGMIMMTSLNPVEPRRVEFHANRPFAYMITDNTTGAILFMGQFTGK